MNKLFGPLGAVLAATALVFAAPAIAQNSYPVGTVTMVVPYAPGGAGDTVGRIVADELAKRLGVNFVVENVGGASGTIGAEKVARAPADGSTLLLAGNAIFTTAPHLAPVGFDPLGDFTAIANVSEAVRTVAANADLPVKTWEEFVAYAQAHPGELNYGSVGVGSTGHVATVDLLRTLGIEAQHIPYTGSSQVVQALLSGDIQFMSDAAVTAQAKQGAVTPLAIAGDRRIDGLPDTPTFVELGVTALRGTGQQMVMGPAGMPAEVVAMVENALKAASEDPAFVDILTRAGVTPRYIAGSELAAGLAAEYEKFDELLDVMGLSTQ